MVCHVRHHLGKDPEPLLVVVCVGNSCPRGKAHGRGRSGRYRNAGRPGESRGVAVTGLARKQGPGQRRGRARWTGDPAGEARREEDK